MNKLILQLFTLLCLLTVQGFASVPTVELRGGQPGGLNAHQLFEFGILDTAGTDDIAWVNVAFGGYGANACIVAWQRTDNRLFLIGDDGSTYLGPATIGSGVVYQNSQCSLSVSASYKNNISNTMYLGLDITFKPAFGGTKSVYGIAGNTTGQNGGWVQIGTWVTPGQPPSYPTMTMTGDGGTGTSGIFSFSVYNSTGAANIVWSNVDFGGSGGGAAGCVLQYSNGQMGLQNDTATAWDWGTVGSNTMATNSRCTLSRATSGWSDSGNTRIIIFDLIFNPSFTGTKQVFAVSGNYSGHNGWQPIATWTIPTGGGGAVPGSEGSTELTDSIQPAVDAFSGVSVNMPTIAHPLPYAELTSPSGTRVVKVGDPITITLSSVKPNTQVWIAETAMADPAAMGGSYVLGGYTGMTDLSGNYIWQTTVGNWLEGHAYTIWVGNWCGNSQTCGARPDSDIVATVVTWVTNASGSPSAPGIFSQLTNQ